MRVIASVADEILRLLRAETGLILGRPWASEQLYPTPPRNAPAIRCTDKPVVILADEPRNTATSLVVHEDCQDGNSFRHIGASRKKSHVPHYVADALVRLGLLELASPVPDRFAPLQDTAAKIELGFVDKQLVESLRLPFIDTPRSLGNQTREGNVIRRFN